jgi:hypothetical protein
MVAAMSGCSHAPSKSVTQPTPLYHVQPGTLRAIDERIFTASVLARHESEAYARIVMDEWLWRVRKRTEEVFIPWYSTYGTQQWIATKVAWYKLMYTEGEATPEERLVSYLQEQFYEQVLKPVSSFIDPGTVMEDTAVYYLRELKGRIDHLPLEYHIPVAAFNQHLESIPAIVAKLEKASLYQVLQAADLPASPAYDALLEEIAAVNNATNLTPSPDKLKIVAKRAVTKLLDSIVLRGGATAASTIVGGFLGLVISAGSAAYGYMVHEKDKPALEAQLRENLDAALDLIWQDLVVDQRGGVAALMYHLSTQIEDAVSHPLQQ